jgi:hypothetical protein
MKSIAKRFRDDFKLGTTCSVLQVTTFVKNIAGSSTATSVLQSKLQQQIAYHGF